MFVRIGVGAAVFLLGFIAAHVSGIGTPVVSAQDGQIGRYQASISARGDRLGGITVIVDTMTGEARVWSTLEGNDDDIILHRATLSYSTGAETNEGDQKFR